MAWRRRETSAKTGWLVGGHGLLLDGVSCRCSGLGSEWVLLCASNGCPVTLALAAYKANGGEDEIDSALVAPSDEHDAPKRFISQQSSSHARPHHDSVLRSQTEPPLSIPVQESTAAAQDALVTPGGSPVSSRSPSLPTSVEEESYGSLPGREVFKGDAIPEESDSDPLQHCPPEGNGPSVSPSSSAPQVGGAQEGRAAETGVRQRVGGSANERSQGLRVRLPSAGTPPPSPHAGEPGVCMHA